jgi:two-component system sensor histidine kinase DegS
MLILTVEDDGHGFDLKKYTQNSLKRCLGLFGMKERAALLGGITLIDTSSGGGTTVTVRVPLEKTDKTEKG